MDHFFLSEDLINYAAQHIYQDLIIAGAHGAWPPVLELWVELQKGEKHDLFLGINGFLGKKFWKILGNLQVKN